MFTFMVSRKSAPLRSSVDSAFKVDARGEHGHEEEEEEEDVGGAGAATYLGKLLFTFSISSSFPGTCGNKRKLYLHPVLLPLKRLLLLGVLLILLGLRRPQRHRHWHRHRHLRGRISPLRSPTPRCRIPVVDSGGNTAASAAEDKLLPLLPLPMLLLLLRF